MAALREIAAHFGVSFDDKALKAGGASIDGIVDKLKGFAGALGAGLALGAIFHFVHGLTEEADALQKQADAMGLSLAEMQEWQYAAMMQGVSAETLNGVLNKLGSGKFDKGLAALGVSTKDASGNMRSSTDVLEDVADSLAAIENPAERNRKAVAVLGKSYAKMLPLMQDGSKGIRELRGEFQEMGGGFDEEFAKNADAFGDNIDRTKVIWKNFGIMIVAQILPALVQLSKWVVSLIKPVIGFVKHSKLMEAGMAALAVKGVMFLSSKIGPLGGALKMLAGNFFKVILPLLILEDLLVFLAGGDSLLGRAIEKAFGPGSENATREWIFGVWKEFTDFISDIKKSPLKLLDDWDLFTTTLSKDIRSTFGDTFGGIINEAGSMFVTFLDLLTGGWDNFTNKIGAIWAVVAIGLKIPFFESAMAIMGAVAWLQDGFNSLWNSVIQGAIKAIEWLGKITGLMQIPGVSKLITAAVNMLGGAQGSETHGEEQSANAYKKRMGMAADWDAAQVRLDAGVKGSAGGSNVGVVNNTTVNVPPGTPSAQANAVAGAAQLGVNKGVGSLKAAQAATKPGGA